MQLHGVAAKRGCKSILVPPPAAAAAATVADAVANAIAQARPSDLLCVRSKAVLLCCIV
jgi:hypothetical protein